MKTMVVNTERELKDLLKSGLRAYQVAKVCKEKGIRLSVLGWSEYAVEDGALKLHYDYHGEEYTDVISSVDELTFFDEDNVGDFEYSQTITADMIQALREV